MKRLSFHIALSLGVTVPACAPASVDIADEQLMHHVGISEVDGALSVRASFGVPFRTPFDCIELSPSWSVTVAGQPLTVRSRGGVAESGWCVAAGADGTLAADALNRPAELVAEDDSTSFVMPLWSTLERKISWLVAPTDAVLEPDVPFTLAWPYATDGVALTLEIPGVMRRTVAVADGLVTAQYPATMLDAAAAEPREIRLTAELSRGVECELRGCSFSETWTTVLPVLVWRAPPPVETPPSAH